MAIKKVKKDVKYYFIGSTTYFNIIANNLLTSDHSTLISNLYGFEENAKWPTEKNLIVSNSENITPYNQLNSVLPYYLYKGFRAGEVGYLIKNKLITIEEFKNYITGFITFDGAIKLPPTINNMLLVSI